MTSTSMQINCADIKNRAERDWIGIMKKNEKRRMRIFSGALSIMLTAAAAGAMPVLAEETGKDWGEYKMDNDGYGYLTANFPDQFTSEYIIEENSVSVVQKTEALMLTLNEEEKKELLQADGYWRGIPRVGIPEIVFYEAENKTPAPGAASVFASYDEENAVVYGKAAAQTVKVSGANAIESDALNAGEEKSAPDEALENAVTTALNQNGIITGLSKKFCDKNVDGMSQEEIDTAVGNILTCIGEAGYFGMVQISRDGLAAIDSDAPETIKLALDGEKDPEAEKTSAAAGAVLLKNENKMLPLKQAPEMQVTSEDTMTETAAEGTSILYIASNEKALSKEQQNFLTEKISAAKAENKKVILVLATSQAIDIEKWAGDCDAILEVWQSIEDESGLIASLLSGETIPGGRLTTAWSDTDAAWNAGYGLSYTQFSYEFVSAEPASENEEDYGLDVTVKVTNTGKLPGADTVQIYTEDGERKTLSAVKKTEVLQAGEEREMVIHISQRGLGTLKDGEWTVQEGNRKLFIAHNAEDETVEAEVEIKAAKSGVSLQAEAPQSAEAGEPFDVKVNTPINVISLQMMDAEGNVYQPVDVLKENMGDSIQFTYTLKIDQAGKAQINIFTTTPEGLSESAAAQVEVEIQ